jgi:hypothetical protein
LQTGLAKLIVRVVGRIAVACGECKAKTAHSVQRSAPTQSFPRYQLTFGISQLQVGSKLSKLGFSVVKKLLTTSALVVKS